MEETVKSHNEFGKVRSLLWPIYASELKKVALMTFIFFAIFVVYNLLRALKVSLLVSATDAGAELIPFVHVGIVLPGIFLTIMLITKLYNYFTTDQVFIMVIGSFIAFFALFLFVLYPNLEAIEIPAAEKILAMPFFPNGFKGMVFVMEYWPLALFFAAAEIWGAAVGCMLFWGFANEVTKVNEAKRFYAVFVLGCNVSCIVTGKFGQWCKLTEVSPYIPYGNDPWSQTLFIQLLGIIATCVLIIVAYRWLINNVYQHRKHETSSFSTVADLKKKNKKEEMSLKNCFALMFRSRYILFIVTIMISYNIVYSMADVLFTAQAKEHTADCQELNDYINEVSFYVGLFSIFFALVICGNVVRYFGWMATALIPPVIWLVSTTAFFSCIFLPYSTWTGILLTLAVHPANAILFFGALQITLGRASKYTVFDESKEMAFIPLSKAEQRKGKAVVDGIASRLGKSGGSFIFFILLAVFGSLEDSLAYIAVVMFAFILFWIYAVYNLGKMVKHAIDEEQPITITDKLEEPAAELQTT